MILWVIVFAVIAMLCMVATYAWKDASYEAKTGLLEHLQMFFISATVLLVILCVIVALF